MNRFLAIALLLTAAPGLAVAGGMHAAAMSPRLPAANATPPVHPAGPGHAHIRPIAPTLVFGTPVFFNPLVPGFVTFAPPVVIVAPAPVPVHQSAVVAAPPVAGIPVAPPVPPSILFFAPPVQVVTPPPPGGQVLIIRRHVH